MHSDKAIGIEFGFQNTDTVITQIFSVEGNKSGVIAVRFNPNDVCNGYVYQFLTNLHQYSFGVMR